MLKLGRNTRSDDGDSPIAAETAFPLLAALRGGGPECRRSDPGPGRRPQRRSVRGSLPSPLPPNLRWLRPVTGVSGGGSRYRTPGATAPFLGHAPFSDNAPIRNGWPWAMEGRNFRHLECGWRPTSGELEEPVWSLRAADEHFLIYNTIVQFVRLRLYAYNAAVHYMHTVVIIMTLFIQHFSFNGLQPKVLLRRAFAV